MPRIAYLANIFPSPVEPYVMDEIRELRRAGAVVTPCSARRPGPELSTELKEWATETVYMRPVRVGLLLRAGWLCVWKFPQLKEFFARALIQKRASERRARALLHTLLGVYCALLFETRRIEHIHVHHGYFGSWIAMVAARVLRIPFSLTLHGSDVLIHATYLDIKLRRCQFCVTVSEFNRRHILENCAEVDPKKILVRRMGVDCGVPGPQVRAESENAPLTVLAVGRLHAVKDHAFLVRACHLLKSRGLRFICCIAGDGPERASLERLMRDLQVEREIRLLGHLARDEIDDQYEKADLVVLTSRSEGIPLVLMEAMAREKVVLAPAITGIPELVLDGVTGFLYEPGSLDDFTTRVELISRARSALGALRRAAREHVRQHFNRETNRKAFCDLLLLRLEGRISYLELNLKTHSYEDPILQ